jgi:hypothetical protein
MLAESSSSIHVNASPVELFSLLSQPLLRLQLAADWGESEFLGADPDFPAPGSTYRLKLKKPVETLWEIGVQAYEPPRRLVFASRQGPHYTAEWLVEAHESGSRLSLIEQIELPEPVEPAAVEAQPPAASTGDLETYFKPASQTPIQERQKLVTDWLASIGRYAGLQNSRLGRSWRRLMDRYLLRLRADQRRIILAIIAMQVVLFLTFVASVVGLGLAGALLR